MVGKDCCNRENIDFRRPVLRLQRHPHTAANTALVDNANGIAPLHSSCPCHCHPHCRRRRRRCRRFPFRHSRRRRRRRAPPPAARRGHWRALAALRVFGMLVLIITQFFGVIVLGGTCLTLDLGSNSLDHLYVQAK
eukprot:scaffold2701_cov96-Isochrysis_galbana.AAC.1